MNLRRSILNDVKFRRGHRETSDRVVISDAVSSSHKVIIKDKSVPFTSSYSAFSAGDQNNINGTSVMTIADSQDRKFALKPLDSTHGIVLFTDGGDSNYPKVAAFEWDGTTFTMGSPVSADPMDRGLTNAHNCDIGVLTSSQVILMYSSGSYTWGYVADVSGTDVTVNTTAEVTLEGLSNWADSICGVNDTDAIYFKGYGANTTLKAQALRVSGGGDNLAKVGSYLTMNGAWAGGGAYTFSPVGIKTATDQAFCTYYIAEHYMGRIVDWNAGTNVLSLGGDVTIAAKASEQYFYFTALSLYDTGKISTLHWNTITDTLVLQLLTLSGSTPSLGDAVDISELTDRGARTGLACVSGEKILGAYTDTSDKLQAFVSDFTPAVVYTAVGNSDTAVKGCRAIELSGDLVVMHQDDANGDKGEIQIFEIGATEPGGSRIVIRNSKEGQERTAQWVF